MKVTRKLLVKSKTVLAPELGGKFTLVEFVTSPQDKPENDHLWPYPHVSLKLEDCLTDEVADWNQGQTYTVTVIIEEIKNCLKCGEAF